MYGALSGENRPAGTGGPFYTADKHTVFYISQTRPPERFAPGAWLSLGHTPKALHNFSEGNPFVLEFLSHDKLWYNEIAQNKSYIFL